MQTTTNNETVAESLSAQGKASAENLRAQGWDGNGEGYEIGAYPGDEEAAEVRIGRKLTRLEALMLEASVRTHLDG